MSAYEDSSLQLHDSVVLRNAAEQGGGVYIEGRAALDLHTSSIEQNNADWGGGVILDSSNLSVAQIQKSVNNNNETFGWDIRALPKTLVNTNSSTVEGFVSRLGTDVGLLNVSLVVTGYQSLPSHGTVVQAMVDDVILSHAVTKSDDTITLPVKLRKPPGAGG